MMRINKDKIDNDNDTANANANDNDYGNDNGNDNGNGNDNDNDNGNGNGIGNGNGNGIGNGNGNGNDNDNDNDRHMKPSSMPFLVFRRDHLRFTSEIICDVVQSLVIFISAVLDIHFFCQLMKKLEIFGASGVGIYRLC